MHGKLTNVFLVNAEANTGLEGIVGHTTKDKPICAVTQTESTSNSGGADDVFGF